MPTATLTIQLTPGELERLSNAAKREQRGAREPISPEEYARRAVLLTLEASERYERARQDGRCHGCGAMKGPHAGWCPGSLAPVSR
jgi:hypothetical protein